MTSRLERATLAKRLYKDGFVCRGRRFDKNELQLIKTIVKRNFNTGRTKASIEICEVLNWRQPNGWLKERACRDVLLKLECIGFLELPAIKVQRKAVINKKSLSNKTVCLDICTEEIEKIEFPKLTVQLVKGGSNEKLWNELVRKYHYLGFNVFVGRSLKYLVFKEKRVVAASGWCDPAWNLIDRDNIMKSLGYTNAEIREKGINNGRFLIMPWVKVKHLASYLQSIIIKKVQRDWREYYSIKPEYLETFVDHNRFEGTCYKASNWKVIGQSKGYKKAGAFHSNSQQPKVLYMYPLTRKLRKAIIHFKGE